MDLAFVINATSDAADDAFDLMKCTLDYLLHKYKNYQVKFQIFLHGDEDTSLREISLPEGVEHLTRNTDVKIPALHDDLRIVEQAFKQSGGSNSEKVGIEKKRKLKIVPKACPYSISFHSSNVGTFFGS